MNLRFMAVVQGRNIKEQLELVKALGDLLPKDSLLGFPRRLTEESTSARLGIMEEVVSAYGMKYHLHMLGLSREWPGEYLRAAQQFGSHLRGLDTSAPYCYAFNQSAMQAQWSAGGERPHNYFLQQENRFNAKLVKYNIYVLSCWNQGVTPVPLKTWEYDNGM